MHIEIGGASEVDRLSLPGELIAILHGRQDAWCQTRPRPPPGGRGPGGGRRWARQVEFRRRAPLAEAPYPRCHDGRRSPRNQPVRNVGVGWCTAWMASTTA